MIKSKHRIGCVIGISFVVLLIGVIIFFSYCLSLAFQDIYTDKYTLDKTDDTFIITILKGAACGKDFNVSEEQFNTYINTKYCSDSTDKQNKLKNIRIYFNQNQSSEIYAKTEFLGYDFGICAKADFKFNTSIDTLSITLSDAKIGKLSIPDCVLKNILYRVIKDNEYLKVNNLTVSVKTKYKYDLKHSSISVELTKFVPQNGYISCCTNNLSKEALNSLKEYLKSEDGKKYLKDKLNVDIDNIKDKIRSIFK